jgi:hypothetical protein
VHHALGIKRGRRAIHLPAQAQSTVTLALSSQFENAIATAFSRRQEPPSGWNLEKLAQLAQLLLLVGGAGAGLYIFDQFDKRLKGAQAEEAESRVLTLRAEAAARVKPSIELVFTPLRQSNHFMVSVTLGLLNTCKRPVQIRRNDVSVYIGHLIDALTVPVQAVNRPPDIPSAVEWGRDPHHATEYVSPAGGNTGVLQIQEANEWTYSYSVQAERQSWFAIRFDLQGGGADTADGGFSQTVLQMCFLGDGGAWMCDGLSPVVRSSTEDPARVTATGGGQPSTTASHWKGSTPKSATPE